MKYTFRSRHVQPGQEEPQTRVAPTKCSDPFGDSPATSTPTPNPGEPEVGALIDRLREPDACERRAASAALLRLSAEAVPALAKASHDLDPTLRRTAVDLLRRMGADAATAAPDLAAALQDRDWLVRMWAADALGHLGEAAESAIPALVKAEKDPSAYVRVAAALAMTRLKMG